MVMLVPVFRMGMLVDFISIDSLSECLGSFMVKLKALMSVL